MKIEKYRLTTFRQINKFEFIIRILTIHPVFPNFIDVVKTILHTSIEAS